MGKNLPGLKRGFHYDPVTGDLGIYLNGVQVESYTEVAGRTYYVNNITGSSGNGGRSWSDAFDEVSTAITASAAYQATHTSGDLTMNNILIQGTSTRYTPITTMPLYTNMIGVGSNPRGYIFGQVRIGSVSTANGSSGDEAGNYWYNIQFSAGGSFDAVDLGVSFCSTWDNCTWGCAADNESCDTGIAVGTGSGSSFINCDTIAHHGTPVLGFSSEGTFNNCVLDNCWIIGTTDALLVAGGLETHTIVKNCTFQGGTYGVHDTGGAGTPKAGVFYTNNYAYGSTAGFSITNNGTTRAIGNIVSDNGTNATYTVYTTIAT